MSTKRLLALHTGKGRNFGTAIRDIIDYIENPEKTYKGQLISSYQCNARLFFDLIDRRYNKEGAYHIVFTSNRSPSLVKGQFRYRKTRYRGLRKQAAKLNMMFALANLILADRPCLAA